MAEHVAGLGDPTLDRYARMVRRSLSVPVALVSIVEEARQVFRGAEGLPAPYQESRATPLSHSFCQYVVADDQPLVITDARLDERLADNLAIPDLGVVAYAGWPIQDHTGRTVGSLCAIDSEPREWTSEELDALSDLADACTAELSERGQRALAQSALRAAEELNERSRLLLAISDRLSATRTVEDVAAAVDEVTRTELGCHYGSVWLRTRDLDGLVDTPRPDQAVSRVEVPGSPARRDASWHINAANVLDECLVEGRSRYVRDLRAEPIGPLSPQDADGVALAALPLALGGRTYGVLELSWPDARVFTLGERRTLTALAAYTVRAVQATLLLRDRIDVAIVLQEAMLTRLPEPVGLELVARYRPAAFRERVGGDWYDAVDHGARGTSLAIGDVSGHDIAAAAVMGQLRNMLRTLDWTGSHPGPAATLVDLDRAMHDLGTSSVASLVFARVRESERDPRHRMLTWSSAGHPPPLLVRPDGEVSVLGAEGRSDLLLGVNADAERREQTVEVEDGSLLLLYTDGLIERRGERFDDGLARLQTALRAVQSATDLGESIDGLLEALLGPGAQETQDDVALLAVRFLLPR